MHECLKKQGVVAEALFRGPQNLHAIEEEVLKVDSSSLLYGHIEPIKQGEPWGGQQFWQWPSRAEFDERCGPAPVISLGRQEQNKRGQQEPGEGQDHR